MKRQSASRSILIFSDIHTGSQSGLCGAAPFIKEYNTTINPNKLQKQLYGYWKWVQDSLIQKPHIILINGEPIDGRNKKQNAMGSWGSTEDQLNEAYKLLTEFPKPNHFLMTRGSNYHVEIEGQGVEEWLAGRLNCVPYSGLFKGFENITDNDPISHHDKLRTDYYITFKVNGKVFSATHHIGFNRWFAYRTTALAREMADMEFLRGRYWKPEDMPSVVIRSHVHYFVYVRFSNQHGFTTPAWKMPDGHLLRGGLGGTAPSIGAIEVIVEPNGKIIVEPHLVDNIKYPKHTILDLS